ncbi:MAG: hypothetical protein AAGI52_10520 [Bacteroidota bacterium]
MSKFYSLALLLLLAIPLEACSEVEDPGQIEVADLRLVRQASGYPELSGVLVNRTAGTVTSADVGITLYDDENLPMDEPARLVVRNVAPGDSAYFRKRLDVDARGARLGYVIAN